MLSYLQETQSGGSVIRAFKKEEMFRKHNYMLVNKNTLANQVCYGVWCWYSIRMDLISTIVVITAVTFVVIDRIHNDPVLLSLML